MTAADNARAGGRSSSATRQSGPSMDCKDAIMLPDSMPRDRRDATIDPMAPPNDAHA